MAGVKKDFDPKGYVRGRSSKKRCHRCAQWRGSIRTAISMLQSEHAVQEVIELLQRAQRNK